MGIRINENIFSLLVNRNLVRANDKLETTFRRLGSGEKITRSGMGSLTSQERRTLKRASRLIASHPMGEKEK